MDQAPDHPQVVMARLVRRDEDDGSFDREFWERVGPEGRFAAAWEMVLDVRRMRGEPGDEPRLRRSVQNIQRR